MNVSMQPSHQLHLPSDGLWHHWTDAFMTLNNDTTFTCNDTGFTFTYNVRFDDYVIEGSP